MTGKELKSKLLSEGVILADLADRLDISPQTLHSRLNAKSIKSDFLSELSAITGISFDNLNAEFKDYRILPILNLDAVGGVNNEEVDISEFINGYMPFKDAREGDICIPVTNNSMYKSYPPGSVVHIREVQRWREFLEPGQDYVFVLEDRRRLIKKARKGHDKHHILLVSENDNYDDVEINVDMISQIWLVLANYNKRVM